MHAFIISDICFYHFSEIMYLNFSHISLQIDQHVYFDVIGKGCGCKSAPCACYADENFDAPDNFSVHHRQMFRNKYVADFEYVLLFFRIKGKSNAEVIDL